MSQPEKLSIPCWEVGSLPANTGKRPLGQYQYQKLGSETELPLLRVRQYTDSCSFEIVHHSLSEDLKYEAISYVWGNPERTHTLLFCDNTTFPLTSSLSTALPYLAARSTTGYLWIDQICINQTDVEERNTEVPKMGTIYKSATRVLAWLGEDNLGTRLVQKIRATAGEMPKKRLTGDYYQSLDPEVIEHVCSLFSVQPGQDSYLQALSHFLSNPWFRRTWCFQEAVLCRHLSFVVGKFELGEALEGLFITILVLKTRLDKAEESQEVILSASLDYLYSMFYQRRQNHLFGSPTPFHILLSQVGAHGEASDPRDTLYGFLGLQTNPNVKLEANYSLSVEESFIKSSRAIIIGHMSLDIFTAIRMSGNYQLPSWVPDWSFEDNHTTEGVAWEDTDSDAFAASAGRRYTPLTGQENSLAFSIWGRSIARVSFVTQPQEPSVYKSDLEEILCHMPLNVYLQQIQRDCPLLENVSRERLLNTLLTDCSVYSFSARPKITDLLHHYDILCSEEERSKLTRSTLDAYVRDLQYLAHPIFARRIFCTMDGKLGYGPRTMKIDDHIAIIHGSQLPLVLRPNGNGEYKLVGVCYLEGVMKGEACTWPEDEADEFVLV